ncbi:MAG TPA: serine hydrolase domain-containing protein, partial [Planctomycetota bacterium]
MSALVLLAPLLLAQDSPTSAGGSLEAVQLEALGAVVQRWADEERIVGAELAVLRGETVLFHRGFGWRHREERVPMEPGGIFCLRSMTKPIVGAAIQMLIDEGRLAPADAVARHLPAFDHEDSRAITIEQLLTHTGGLGLSSLVGRDLAAFTGERALAELIGHEGPAHAPGAGFHYSDDGADVLGALVELVSELELEAFLRARLFEPLGLDDMAGVMTREHPLRARLCSAYAGGPGAWTRYFGPADPPLFPFLLGSQGLYGSVRDYARFLSLWQG